jgi:enamine deaminase RidA (YjgF/YER057c/UK114 family)
METKALQNISAVLEAAGSGLKLVVKFNVYLSKMSDFFEMSDAYAKVSTDSSRLRLL